MRSLVKLVVLAFGAVTFVAGVANGQAFDTKRWALERMIANTESVGRESGIGAQLMKIGTGVSIKDIQEHGLAGGENSVVRRPLGTFGKAIGLDIKLF